MGSRRAAAAARGSSAVSRRIAVLVSDACAASKLPIGLRRSYGDSCLNGAGALTDMCGLDRFISFDAENGILRVMGTAEDVAADRLVIVYRGPAPTRPPGR